MCAKLTIAEMKAIAVQRGGLCLSSTYINSETKLKWKCNKGHEWYANPHNIKSGTWCPTCGYQDVAEKLKLTIEQMRDYAVKRGGECLSDRYIGRNIRLLWKCAKGHQWEATPSSVYTAKSWCPVCAGNIKLTLQEMKLIAKDRGGECLSEEYVNSLTKLRWKCKEGHEWEAEPVRVKILNNWCPKCGGTAKLTLEEMRKLAQERSGKCLSNKYINANTKLRWECAEGHVWEATPHAIKDSGTWCPTCSGYLMLTIEEMRELAKKKNGECLSTKYINAFTPLRWRCKYGHEWEAKPHHIKASGSWCPVCSAGTSERVCRAYFEKLFKKKFPKQRPSWLVNNRGRQMELDGYNRSLGVAFEYQGKQHYESIKLYHNKIRNLGTQIKDDEQKKILCKENNVVLVRVPYWVSYEKMGDYILRELRNEEIQVSHNKIIDYRTFNTYPADKLAEMRRIAKSKGGECLSDKYINSFHKLKWRCINGHVWEAMPYSVKYGKWCPFCAGHTRLTIQEMKQIAREQGGWCLSTKYVNSNTKLRWRCSKGHEWMATPSHIKISHRWCPFCAGLAPLTLEQMKSIARERGGECLSVEYINSKTKLRWSCKNGHIWDATPNSVKRGTWCPHCRFAKS